MSYQTCPTYEQPISVKGQTHTAWYRFFQGVFKGTPPGTESTISVGISPYAYIAPAKGFMIISGGSVSAVQISRTITTLTNQTSGIFPLSQGDTLTVTFATPPTMTWYPT